MAPLVPIATRPLIFGHRGCRGLRPENTLPGFLHALEWPVMDGLELDVIISADGEVVVSHEPWLNSLICRGADNQILTEEAGLAANLYQLPYAAIRRFDCGSLAHQRFPEQQLQPAYKPTLQEVLLASEACAQHLPRRLPRYSIELKSTPATDGLYHPAPSEFVARVGAVIAASLPPHRTSDVALLSFDHRVVQEARKQLPRLPVCLLIEDERPLTEHLRQVGFVPDLLGPSHELIDLAYAQRCAALALPIIAWTVNDAARMRQLADLPVAGITTDYPDRAQAVFAV